MKSDIPVPESMKFLPIRKGLPVPYVADWTGETDSYVTHDSKLNRKVLATGGRMGTGEPMFGRQNPMRQRQCMMNNRCQVCSNDITEDYVWFIAGWVPNDANVAAVEPLVPVIEEPPLCTPCARYAVQICPGLRRDVEGQYSGLIVYKTYEYQHLMQAGNIPGAKKPVVHFVLAQLMSYTKFTVPEFLELTA